MAKDNAQRNICLFEAVLNGRTLLSAGKDYGITPERVRQIIRRLLREMLHPSRLGTDVVPGHEWYWYRLPQLRLHKEFWLAQLKKRRANS